MQSGRGLGTKRGAKQENRHSRQQGGHRRPPAGPPVRRRPPITAIQATAESILPTPLLTQAAAAPQAAAAAPLAASPQQNQLVSKKHIYSNKQLTVITKHQRTLTHVPQYVSTELLIRLRVGHPCQQRRRYPRRVPAQRTAFPFRNASALVKRPL